MGNENELLLINGIIFGHTHIPDTGTKCSLDNIELYIYNTGGWLKDTAENPEVLFFDGNGKLGSKSINKKAN